MSRSPPSCRVSVERESIVSLLLLFNIAIQSLRVLFCTAAMVVVAFGAFHLGRSAGWGWISLGIAMEIGFAYAIWRKADEAANQLKGGNMWGVFHPTPTATSPDGFLCAAEAKITVIAMLFLVLVAVVTSIALVAAPFFAV